VALVGSPNAGKTSLFNHLTGLRAKTGNYPGVTVSRSAGVTHTAGGPVLIEDLPGTYSLAPISPDERIVADLLHGTLAGVESPDALAVVADVTTLARSMTLVADVLRLGLPTMLILTMTDELAARGGHLDSAKLSAALGIPVRSVVGNRGTGIAALKGDLADPRAWSCPPLAPPDSRDEAEAWADSILAAANFTPPQPDSRTSRVDAVLLHPVSGVIIFFAVMFAFFQVIFAVAAPLQELLGQGLGWIGGQAPAHLGEGVLGSLVAQGIIGGVGTVIGFLPQIVLLFLLIALLENVGYMSRAALLMDRVMAATGLEGRAFVAMLSSFACAIPGIMATRTLPSAKDRIATIITAPLMTCSARLPVYTLLVGLLVGPNVRWAGLGAQGTVMFLLYLGGGLSALIAAAVFKSSILRGDSLPFTMELPPYRLPSVKTVLLAMWGAAMVFLRKAGTIILVTSLALWVLLSLPTRDHETAGKTPAEATAYVMDHSYAADIGKAIEPLFAPLGFDWRMDIALLGSLSAREVFVSTLGQVAAADDPEDPQAALHGMTKPDGGPLFTAPTVIALLLYFMFALQCMSTVAVMRRETNGWKWPVIAWGYMFGLAWVMAFLGRTIAIACGA
jgi:ferrous iron transport protein B